MATLTAPATPLATSNPTLDQLTDTILLQHARVEMTTQQFVEQMIECGDTMIEARALVPQGQWGAYVKNRLGMHRKTASTYIRFAQYADLLRREQPATVHAARRVLHDLGVPRINNSVKQQDEAKRLRKAGMTYDQIAEHFEVPTSTVSYWLNKTKLNANKRRHAKALQDVKKQEQRKRSQRAMREARDTELGIAYSHVRKALDRLRDRDDADNETAEVSELVSQAMSALYRAEDKLVAASRAKYCS